MGFVAAYVALEFPTYTRSTRACLKLYLNCSVGRRQYPSSFDKSRLKNFKKELPLRNSPQAERFFFFPLKRLLTPKIVIPETRTTVHSTPPVPFEFPAEHTLERRASEARRSHLRITSLHRNLYLLSARPLEATLLPVQLWLYSIR